MLHWNALMRAPKNSPCGGYVFKSEIDFPENYPNSRPVLKCKDKIYHINIRESDGSVFLQQKILMIGKKPKILKQYFYQFLAFLVSQILIILTEVE